MKLWKFVFIFIVLCDVAGLYGNTPPVVGNVNASQRTDGSKIVDIWYNVSDADNDTLSISMQVSNDNGITFGINPSPANLSGAIGNGILSGSNKHIVWNAGAEAISYDSNLFKVKVVANDIILTEGLVAYYPFNGNANDESGNGHNATANNATQTTDRFGNINSAYLFNGVSTYLQTDGTGLPLGNSNRTITCWVKLNSYSQYEAYMVGYGGWGNMDSIYGLSCHSYFNNKLMFSQWGDEITSTSIMSLNQWYLCCATNVGNSVNLYLNGNLETTGNIEINTTQGDMLMGSCFYLGGHFLNGSLDDVRIYDRALSEQEIQALYHEGGWPYLSPIEMVSVQGGYFSMGDTHNTGFANELPLHQVYVSPFTISNYEITQDIYTSTMGDNPSYFNGMGSRPVEQVSWYHALVFCNKRSISEGLVPVYYIAGSTNPDNWGDFPLTTNIIDYSTTLHNATWDAVICNWSANGYRLPTEAEWEFAAKGGNQSNSYLYSGSNDIGTVAWYNSNISQTADVGLKLENEIGGYDFSGNVHEWCWDSYALYSSAPLTNPTGSENGVIRVLRGGSIVDSAYLQRTSWRNVIVGPAYYSFACGFRVVRRSNY